MGCESNFSEYWSYPPDSTLKKYGRYYAWLTVMQLSCKFRDSLAFDDVQDSAFHTQGLCPKGWHVPTMDECRFLSIRGPFPNCFLRNGITRVPITREPTNTGSRSPFQTKETNPCRAIIRQPKGHIIRHMPFVSIPCPRSLS